VKSGTFRAVLPLLLVLSLAQAPSAVPDTSVPPLVPMQDAQSPEVAPPSPPPAPAIEEPEAQAPTAPRPKRIAGTVLGAFLGDAVTVGIWVLEGGFVLASCGLSPGCISPAILISLGIATVMSFGPLGPLAGNRVAGGRAPYWKLVCGTAAGLVLSGVVLGLFSATGAFNSSAGSYAGVGVSLLPLIAAQTVSSELGEP
jgi:hypothetical protein